MFTFVNLWELSEHKLFDDIKLPTGIDKDILINTIFDECAEFEPLTIDVNLMKAKINNFFARNYDNFKRLYEYTQLKYNPIENYDRYSETSGTDKNTTKRITKNSNIDEIKISAYDSSTYQNNQLENVDVNGSDDTTINNTNNVSEHTHGNIGVTTTVQMLEQDTNYWNKNNMYQTIAEKFMFTFMITTI